MYIYADFCIIYHAVWSENVTDQQKNEEDVHWSSDVCSSDLHTVYRQGCLAMEQSRCLLLSRKEREEKANPKIAVFASYFLLT